MALDSLMDSIVHRFLICFSSISFRFTYSYVTADKVGQLSGQLSAHDK